MIELFTANTPNGWKISIMLEEIGYEYKVTKIDLGKDEQFNLDFIKKSPLIHDNSNDEISSKERKFLDKYVQDIIESYDPL